MKLLGLNSPEIFIILVVFLSILGTKRIEKGFLFFKKLLKFLLSNEESQKLEDSEVKSDEPEASQVKEEIIEAEVKSDEPEASQVKEEIIEAEEKSDEPEASQDKEEIIEAEVESDEPEAIEIPKNTIKPEGKSIKAKKRALKDK